MLFLALKLFPIFRDILKYAVLKFNRRAKARWQKKMFFCHYKTKPIN